MTFLITDDTTLVVRIQEEEEDMESEEENDMFGYQPLPQGDDDDDEDMEYSQLHSDDEQDVRDPPSIEIDESNKLAPGKVRINQYHGNNN